jgi:hypothetical protein
MVEANRVDAYVISALEMGERHAPARPESFGPDGLYVAQLVVGSLRRAYSEQWDVFRAEAGITATEETAKAMSVPGPNQTKVAKFLDQHEATLAGRVATACVLAPNGARLIPRQRTPKMHKREYRNLITAANKSFGFHDRIATPAWYESLRYAARMDRSIGDGLEMDLGYLTTALFAGYTAAVGAEGAVLGGHAEFKEKFVPLVGRVKQANRAAVHDTHAELAMLAMDLRDTTALTIGRKKLHDRMDALLGSFAR